MRGKEGNSTNPMKFLPLHFVKDNCPENFCNKNSSKLDKKVGIKIPTYADFGMVNLDPTRLSRKVGMALPNLSRPYLVDNRVSTSLQCFLNNFIKNICADELWDVYVIAVSVLS